MLRELWDSLRNPTFLIRGEKKNPSKKDVILTLLNVKVIFYKDFPQSHYNEGKQPERPPAITEAVYLRATQRSTF